LRTRIRFEAAHCPHEPNAPGRGYAVSYLAGLVCVVLLTDGLYTGFNADANWNECDDCLPFMMDDAWFRAKVGMLVYTASWLRSRSLDIYVAGLDR
jgi:hypothetical protein